MLALYMSFIDDELDRRLFEEIYINYRKQMFLVAKTVLGSDSSAEDIVHDVFLKIAKKHMPTISKIGNDTDLRNYLLKATKNTALDYLRKHRHEQISYDADIEFDIPKSSSLTDDDFVEIINNTIEYERVLSAIISLKDIYRDVMYYHFVMDLSVPEVPKLIDCKVSTVKQRLVRGKKILLKQLLGGSNEDNI